jgi:hypothetical protein
MVSNQELLANKEGTICSQTTEESKENRNVRYPPTEATRETVAKIYYSPVEPAMGLKVDSNEKNDVGREASHGGGHQYGTCILNVSCLCKKSISVSACYSLFN